jgi:hypothetical protein
MSIGLGGEGIVEEKGKSVWAVTGVWDVGKAFGGSFYGTGLSCGGVGTLGF